MKTMQQIFDKHGCDKGSDRHRYDLVYEPALQHLRDKPINILEIGIFRGESLKSWVDYFPNARVYGIDIFTRVAADDLPILEHERVYWANCDSIEGPNDAFIELVRNTKFDVIIDDGLHTHDSQRCTFENFMPRLKDDGVYFIEDVWPFDVMTDKEKQHRWMLKNPKDYSDKQYTQLRNAVGKYDVKFHDHRKQYEPDTYVIEIRKG